MFGLVSCKKYDPMTLRIVDFGDDITKVIQAQEKLNKSEKMECMICGPLSHVELAWEGYHKVIALYGTVNEASLAGRILNYKSGKYNIKTLPDLIIPERKEVYTFDDDPKFVFPLPSDAVRSMIEGLKEWSDKDDFIINMDTFGYSDYVICYGCAATCTVLHKIPTHIEDFQDEYEEESTQDKIPPVWQDFESVIDCFRSSMFENLLDYYGNFNSHHHIMIAPNQKYLPSLSTSNWKENLPSYEKFLADLLEAGI